MKKRDPGFDILKFLAMFMVVFCHIWDAAKDVRTVTDYAVNVTLSVDMPLFFVISGYFARRMLLRMDSLKLVNRLLTYIWPVIVFGTIDAIIACCTGRIAILDVPYVAFKSWVCKFWFFHVLALCDLFSFIAWRICSLRKWHWSVCAVVVYVGALMLPEVLNKRLFVNLLPFYLFGVCCLPGFLEWPRYRRLPFGMIVFSLWIGAVMLAGNFWQNGMALYSNHINVYDFAWNDVWRFVCRYAIGICGVLGLVVLVQEAMRRMPRMERLAPLGTLTLGIYFVHRWFISAWFACGDGDSLSWALLGSLVVYLLSYSAVWMSKKFAFLDECLLGLKIKRAFWRKGEIANG